MLNLSTVLEDTAEAVPDRDAVVLGEVRMTYAEVNAAANRVANLLRLRGIGRGDKVALCCPNLPHFPAVYYGILKVGAVVVPLSVVLGPDEIAYLLRDSEAKAFFCYVGDDLPLGERGLEGFRRVDACEHFFLMPGHPSWNESPVITPELRRLCELCQASLAGQPPTFESAVTQPTDTAVILYGSGTTGRPPMGAELTHENMVLNAMLVEITYERRHHDVSLVVVPLFHSFGQTMCMNVGFLRKATLVLLQRFEPARVLEAMDGEGVTIFVSVPSMYWELLTSKETEGFDLSRIRGTLALAISGGAGMPRTVLEEFKERYGVEILEGYGMSETSPVVSFNRPGPLNRPGSIGLPLWGVEMKLIGDDGSEVIGAGAGELAVRGHNVMKGYYNQTEATARAMPDSWLRTGDLASRDADGYFYLVGRAMDTIFCGGMKIHPRDIEDALMAHPEVSIAAVVGAPHELLGERPVAYVVRTSGSTLTEAELISWAKANATPHALPHVVKFRDALPMTATGKILKRELR